MKEFDYVIIGGGCAGLSLAYELEINDRLKDKTLAIIENRKEYKRDKTWSFWKVFDHNFDDCVIKSWNNFTINTQESSHELTNKTFQLGDTLNVTVERVDVIQREIILDALFGGTTPGMNEDAIADQMFDMMRREELNPTGRAMGGSVPQTERIPNGMQIDGRGGGFIPMGARERKDDVPAMLAKNEFVMTADAVRGAGDGNVNVGAQRMYDLMNSLESKV